jgi:hypothetical protein
LSKLTQSARNQPCTIRIPGVCCFDPATTVPCHYRLAGLSGIGLKSSDLFFADGCVNCHDAVDRRRFKDLDRDYVRFLHMEGVLRTQYRMLQQGLIEI